MTNPRQRASIRRHHCYAVLSALLSVLLLTLVTGPSPAAAQCAPNNLGCEDIIVRAPTTQQPTSPQQSMRPSPGRPFYPPPSYNPEKEPSKETLKRIHDKMRKGIAKDYEEAARKAAQKAAAERKARAEKAEAERKAREKLKTLCRDYVDTWQIYCHSGARVVCGVMGGGRLGKWGGLSCDVIANYTCYHYSKGGRKQCDRIDSGPPPRSPGKLQP